MGYYAHSLENGIDETSWHLLEAHLSETAQRAETFGKVFGSGEWTKLAGLWHDLGKYLPEFQARLRGERISVEHSGVGAAFAASKHREFGTFLAFVIAGHHAGLPNFRRSGEGMPKPLEERLRENQTILKRAIQNAPDAITEWKIPELPAFLSSIATDKTTFAIHAEFWIRFLFSSLVDADWLDTEAFFNPEKATLRGGYVPLSELKARLDTFLAQKVDKLSSLEQNTVVNTARKGVLTYCREAAKQKPGFFSLTVPTGGGKTLSSMAFALDHAQHHGLQRVIAVIPYTSIIEQNADVYRVALGEDQVIEHHSNLDLELEREKQGEEISRRHRLASENWDAPIIVTTTVQFFESLFSNKSSRCRKLHNIARSVVILDEVQSLPAGFLLSILDGLKELIAHYGCSVVLSTATPPALTARERFPDGLENVKPIIPSPGVLASQLKRVQYAWPDVDLPGIEWSELAQRLVSYSQVLTVVHKRADARCLANELKQCVPDEPVIHLSALMCPAHRRVILKSIRETLQIGGLCRVVSTQLVEAGVDLDFPVVFRALGGLDSIVQAAGRCNREGKRKMGEVVVFRSISKPPFGTPRKALSVMESMLREYGTIDIEDVSVFEDFFRRLYFLENKDVQGIQTERAGFNFATVGKAFQLIEDGFTQPLVVPYGDAENRISMLESLGPSAERLRALQPYTVQVYEQIFRRWEKDEIVREVVPGVFILTAPYLHLYDDTFGLMDGDEPVANPEALIIS